MGRRFVAIGSIGVIFLLMITTFSSIASSQKVQFNEMQKNVFQQIREKIKDYDWTPGDFLMAIILFIIITIGFLKGEIFY